MASTIKFDTLSTPDGLQTKTLSSLITSANSVITNDWAAKAAPTSWSSAYKNIWNKSAGSNKSMDAASLNYGIKILVDGYYDIQLHQRSNGAGDGLVGISLNGDRTTLENRADGVWTHGHGTYSGEFIDSYYIGKLFANEIISGGSNTGTNLLFGTNTYIGVLIIKRIG